MADADFEQRLSDEAASWRTENAPAGLPTCPNCRNRVANPKTGAQGSDYFDCTAEIVLPIFAVFSPPCRAPINLKHFDPAASYAARNNSLRCPLFEQR